MKRLLKRLRGDHIVAEQSERLASITRGQSEHLHELIGKQAARQVQSLDSIADFRDVEFSVYSQFGDDGIIQWLIRRIPNIAEVFIEFGVEDYQQANTRFLFLNNGWKGLVLDGSEANIKAISQDRVGFLGLQYKAAFVTAENINDLLAEQGFVGDIGLLHIDIDGNDYWVWRSIEVVKPAIVIMEWNSVFGPDRAITTQYDPAFVRGLPPTPACLCCGASLLSLCDLADSKGYVFVGSNSAGNNAYFVRRDLDHGLKALSAREGYVESMFVESVDTEGRPLRGNDRLEAIKGMTVYNTRTAQTEPI